MLGADQAAGCAACGACSALQAAGADLMTVFDVDGS